ncbi:MAG: DUF1338 domain-containing protein [Planctomycetia bacterium]|nr:DUF1338 domain-containing protein [Planctomycetia bacterium]
MAATTTAATTAAAGRTAVPEGPHRRIATQNAREGFLVELFDRLWDPYRKRVAHVAKYEEVVRTAGGKFVNDHIAFRTFACQTPSTGIASVSRIFEALGYTAAGCYVFPDKLLAAVHFQHPNAEFPKLFVSELQTWRLDAESRRVILKTVAGHRASVKDDVLSALARLDEDRTERSELMDAALDWFCKLPWEPPEKATVTALNKASQYAAWVAVHGYNVNHFTALINSHGTPALADIEKTAAALAQAGVPMKKEFEGARGSKLRQTATEAVVIDVDVLDSGRPAKMPWTYAYFELAERGEVADPETGRRARFEGFLGPQATNLFEMTRVK